jgi:tetratricopeptide (TPR) repeat protein
MSDWDDAEQCVERAHELYERGQWQAALDELKAAIAINPFNGSWLYNLGLTYDALDRYQDAIAAYRKALEINPEDLEVLCALGINCNRMGHFDEAISFFSHIEKLDASYEPCYCNRIISHAEKGDHEKAEEMFFLARQYRERCPVCYYHMGSSLFARRLFDRALWCWQQVLAIAPDYPQVHARIADALWAKGQLQEARGHFIEEIRSNPGNIDVKLDLGELLMELGEPAPAGEKFRQVLELAPEEATALYRLGQIALQEGQFSEAMDFYRRTLKTDRTYPGAHLCLAQIYLQQKLLAEATYHANSELAQQTNDEDTLIELGNLFMDLDQLGPAETTFQRVLLANPENAAARHNLAVTLLKAQRVDEGIEEERRALRVQPKYMLAMHNLALACMTKGDLTRARFWLREALDIAPDDPQLRQLQGRLRLISAWTGVRRVIGRLIGS